jgi:uncharacterized protein (TIGR03435 family)
VRRCGWIGALLGTAALAAAQGAPTPSFEVAAINHVLLSDELRKEIVSGRRRTGITITDTRVSISYQSLAEIVRLAFRAPEDYRLSAPQWLNELRFDIQATIPASASRDQVPEMLQTLLIQRFGLVTHRESRDLQAYALIVGEEGPKLRESSPQGTTADATQATSGEVETAKRQPVTPGSLTATTKGKPMTTMKTETFTMTMQPGHDGAILTDFSGISMPELAQNLGFFVGRPVVDQTGLTGRYDITLEASPKSTRRVARRQSRRA